MWRSKIVRSALLRSFRSDFLALPCLAAASLCCERSTRTRPPCNMPSSHCCSCTPPALPSRSYTLPWLPNAPRRLLHMGGFIVRLYASSARGAPNACIRQRRPHTTRVSARFVYVLNIATRRGVARRSRRHHARPAADQGGSLRGEHSTGAHCPVR